ncbi:MAG: glycosyltransferase family A protein [Planctomycetota bacterium]|jgi:glycosyltransferase involved in cell wall biosynthesis
MAADDAAGLRARGQALYERGDLEAALEAYRRLLALEPDSAEVLSDLGAICFALGRLRQSAGYVARALRADPGHAEALQNARALCQAAGVTLESLLAGGGDGGPTGACCDLSVIVPVHSRLEALDKCLDALYSQSFPAERWEVLAVANGLDSDSARRLESVLSRWRDAFGPRLRTLQIHEASIALARNEGIANAGGTVVLQINEDTVLSRTALAEHFEAHQRFQFDPRSALVGGRSFPRAYLRSLFNYLHESIPLYTALHQPRPRFLGGHRWFVTCNLSALREAYERFGTYDPSFAWGSDQQLGRRWEEQGVRIYVDTRLVGYHLHWISFDSWKGKCIEGAPHWFRRHMGMAIEELPPEGREAARKELESLEAESADIEAELRRLEEAFPGPDAFGGVLVMGRPVFTLAEFNYRLRPLIRDYRKWLQYREMCRRLPSEDGGRRPGQDSTWDTSEGSAAALGGVGLP